MIRLGTRGSMLARRQSAMVADALRALGHDVELVHLTTPGDADRAPLPGRAHAGIFTASLSEAIAAGTIDAAVHSCKDLPVDAAAAAAPTALVSMPRREDPRDALVGAALEALPSGAIVGTCSVRRAAWVARTRPELVVRPIRGNVDERIARCAAGEYDAIILAVAGLRRLGRAEVIAQVIASHALLPAPAQGALALEARVDDRATIAALRQLDHAPTRLAAVAERAVLAAIDPTDATAVGALGTSRGGVLSLTADLDRDGRRHVVTVRAAVPDEAAAAALGLRAARELALLADPESAREAS